MPSHQLRIDDGIVPRPQAHFYDTAAPVFHSLAESRELAMNHALRHAEEKYLRCLGLREQDQMEFVPQGPVTSRSVELPTVQSQPAPLVALRRAA